MSSKREIIPATGRHESAAAVVQPLFLAPVLLLEVAAAAALVVGLFVTASQPLTWSSAVQFLMCCAVGVLLWITDTHLNACEESTAAGDDICNLRETAGQAN